MLLGVTKLGKLIGNPCGSAVQNLHADTVRTIKSEETAKSCMGLHCIYCACTPTIYARLLLPTHTQHTTTPAMVSRLRPATKVPISCNTYQVLTSNHCYRAASVLEHPKNILRTYLACMACQADTWWCTCTHSSKAAIALRPAHCRPLPGRA